MTTPKAILVGLSLVALSIALRAFPAFSSMESYAIASAIQRVSTVLERVKMCRE